jgi:hypothetical protein
MDALISSITATTIISEEAASMVFILRGDLKTMGRNYTNPQTRSRDKWIFSRDGCEQNGPAPPSSNGQILNV